MVRQESDILKKVLKENIKNYLMKLFPQIIIGHVTKESGQNLRNFFLEIKNFRKISKFWPEKRKIHPRQNAIIKVTAKLIQSFWLKYVFDDFAPESEFRTGPVISDQSGNWRPVANLWTSSWISDQYKNSGQDLEYLSSEYFSCDVVQNTTDKSIENHEIIHQVTSHDDRKRLSSERSTVETTRINHFRIKIKKYFLKITYAKYSDVSFLGY